MVPWDREQMNREEIESLTKILDHVSNHLKQKEIETLKSSLQNFGALHNMKPAVPDYNSFRNELAIYFQAVHLLGTRVGGTIDPDKRLPPCIKKDKALWIAE